MTTETNLHFYEIPLNWTADGFHVANPNDLGDGWASESDLLHEIADGATIEEIPAADLPAPLHNSSYSALRIFHMAGPNYFGVAEKFGGSF